MRAHWQSAALVFAVVAATPMLFAQGVGTRGSDPAIHGVPPSVTSYGFGGHPGFHGVPPSVTSLNFGDGRNFGHGRGVHRGPGSSSRTRNRSRVTSPFYGGYYYAPYDYPYYVMDPGVDDTLEDEYARPGPTIFDSHGMPGGEYARPMPPPERDYRAEINREPAAEERAPQEPVADEPATVLVFKDGHQQEIANYAIIGSTLYDLSEGKSKKVALAELDLSATVKQNDDRGVEFKLPVATN